MCTLKGGNSRSIVGIAYQFDGGAGEIIGYFTSTNGGY
jgi:hypothetical protein